MNNKRNKSLLLGLMLPLLAGAQATFTENGIVYTEDLSDPSKLAVIVVAKKSPMVMEGMSAYEGDIVVPSKVAHDLDEYDVVGIAQGAFMCQELESLIINDGPTKIMTGTINSPVLTKLVLPNTVTSIDGIMIMASEDVEFGNSLKTIKNSIFGGEMETLNFPASLQKMEMVSVMSMTGSLNLKNLKLGDKMDYIKMSISFFPGESLVIPSCKNIEMSFSQCTNLKKLELKEGIQSIKNSFSNVEKLEELIVPGSCKVLDNAFCMTDNIQNLEFKEGVEQIIQGFFAMPKLKKLSIPKSVKEISNCFSDLSGLDELTIEEGVENITRSFRGMAKIKKFRLPASVKAIQGSFGSMENLEELYIDTTAPIDYGSSFYSDKLKNIYVKWTTPPAIPSFIKYIIDKKESEIILGNGNITDVPTVHVPKGTRNAYIEAWGLGEEVERGIIKIAE